MMSSSLCCCCWCCFLSVAGAKSTPFADSRRHESEPDNRLSWRISSSSCSLIDFVLPRVTLRMDSPLWTHCMLDWWRDAWGTVTGAEYSRNGRITAWISKWLCYSSRSLSLFKKKQSRLLAFAVMTSICTGQESDDVQLHLMRSKEVASWSNWGKQKSVLWFWMYQFAYRYRCWWSRKEGRWSMLLTEPAWQCGIYNLCSSNCVLSKFIEQIWWWIHWTRS